MFYAPLPIAEGARHAQYARLRDAAHQQAQALRREAIDAAWHGAVHWWRSVLFRSGAAAGAHAVHSPLPTRN